MYLRVCAGFNDYVPVTRGNKDSVSTLPPVAACTTFCKRLVQSQPPRHGLRSRRPVSCRCYSVRGTGSTGIIITPGEDCPRSMGTACRDTEGFREERKMPGSTVATHCESAGSGDQDV